MKNRIKHRHNVKIGEIKSNQNLTTITRKHPKQGDVGLQLNPKK